MILFLDSWLQPCHKGHRAQVQLRERNFDKDFICLVSIMGFSGGSDGKETTCNAGDLGSVSGLGSSSGEGHGKPLQYSCLENPMNRGAWWATVQFSSVVQSYPTLCDPMNRSTPGFTVHHQLPGVHPKSCPLSW